MRLMVRTPIHTRPVRRNGLVAYSTRTFVEGKLDRLKHAVSRRLQSSPTPHR